MHTFAAQSRSQKLFLKRGRLVAKIFNGQSKLKVGVSFLTFSNAALLIILRSADFILIRQEAGQSSRCSFQYLSIR